MGKKFRVNEDKRTVRAYNEDIISEEDFSTVERYTKLGYKVVLIPNKPKAHKHIKNDMIKYLEGNIKDELYIEFVDRVEKNEKFLITKWWLEKELQKSGKDTIEDIINRAKSKENKIIEKAKEQATTENKKLNESKVKVNENK